MPSDAVSARMAVEMASDSGRELYRACRHGHSNPVIVRMRVDCDMCGHHEDETYEFDLPRKKAQPMEASEPGKCPECGAPIQMHLKRWQQVQ